VLALLTSASRKSCFCSTIARRIWWHEKNVEQAIGSRRGCSWGWIKAKMMMREGKKTSK
jgi:hypothetical protein